MKVDIKLFLCLTCLIFCTLGGYSQSLQLTAVTINPPSPTSCTNTGVVMSGSHLCANAVIQGSSHSISGNVITVNLNVMQGLICLPALMPYAHPHNLGMIPAGTYTLVCNYLENGLQTASITTTIVVTACCTVNANFTASATSVCPGTTVSFVAADTSLLSYTWSVNGSVFSSSIFSSQTFTQPGQYTINLTTSDGSCTDSTQQTIGVSNLNSSIGQVIGESCPGDQDGMVDLNAVGVFTPYTYLWSNGSTTQDLTGVPGGTYTVLITDNIGCTVMDTAVVMTGAAVAAGFTASAGNAVCTGDSVSFTNTSSSSGSLTYAWFNNGQQFSQATDPGLTFSTAGSFTIMVIATSTTCSDTSSMTFSVSAGPSSSGTTLEESCPGSNDGSVDLTVSGGLPPYSYSWSNGATTQDLSQVGSGTYTVLISDSIGCSAIDTFEVITGSGIMASFATTSPPNLCPGESAPLVNTSTGGTDFTWLSNGVPFATGSNATIVFPTGGIYNVTVVAADSFCSDTSAAFTFTVTEAPMLSPVVTDESCPNTGDGSITLNLSGGTPPFAFGWDNGATTPDVQDLGPGTYILTVVDAGGCTHMDTFEIVTLGGVTANFSFTGGPAVQFTDLSDTTAVSWLWDFGDGNTSMMQDPIHSYNAPGDYLVCLFVTDAFGCMDTTCMLVGILASLDPDQFVELGLYPNPNDGQFILDLSALRGETVELSLYDALGRRVHGLELTAMGEKEIDIRHLPNGTYYVLVTAGEQFFRGKIVKR